MGQNRVTSFMDKAHNAEILEITFLLMRRPIISHRFSMGFRSGDWVIQCNLSIPFPWTLVYSIHNNFDTLALAIPITFLQPILAL